MKSILQKRKYFYSSAYFSYFCENLFLMSQKIKVLVVDDSSLMRLFISDLLNGDEQIEVLGTAKDGKEAHELCVQLKPDVVVLDMVMENYDGLYATQKIMQDFPVPILVFSSFGKEGDEWVNEILEAGAYAFFPKPKSRLSPNVGEIRNEIIFMVKKAALRLVENKFDFSPIQNPHYEAIVIGSSTGGTQIIEDLLLNLPPNLPIPIFIVQHTAKTEYLYSFAKRLNIWVKGKVQIMEVSEKVQAKYIYLASVEKQLEVRRLEKNKIYFQYSSRTQNGFYRPSINDWMQNLSEIYQEKLIGILLTGMGNDGTEGMKTIQKNGGLTIAQKPETCLARSMPERAIMADAVQHILAPTRFPDFLIQKLSQKI